MEGGGGGGKGGGGQIELIEIFVAGNKYKNAWLRYFPVKSSPRSTSVRPSLRSGRTEVDVGLYFTGKYRNQAFLY